jgi:hypothetical protein
MGLVVSQRLGFAAFALTLVAGCKSETSELSLAELGARDDVRVEPAVERDVCRCRCGDVVCWNLTCSGEGCSESDEYTLRVRHDPDSATSDCLPATPVVEARLLLDGDTLAPFESHAGCGDLEFTWRGLPASFAGELEHRVTIRDSSATWTIVNPFREVTATLLAPPTDVTPPPGSLGSVAQGETVLVGLVPALRVLDASASLSSRVRHGEAPYDLAVAIAGDALTLTVPVTVPVDRGAFDLELLAKTELARDACMGPSSCRGRSVFATWPVRIEERLQQPP